MSVSHIEMFTLQADIDIMRVNCKHRDGVCKNDIWYQIFGDHFWAMLASCKQDGIAFAFFFPGEEMRRELAQKLTIYISRNDSKVFVDIVIGLCKMFSRWILYIFTIQKYTKIGW